MATNSDNLKVTPTSHNSVGSDSQVILQPSSSTITTRDPSCQDHQWFEAEYPAFQSVMPSHLDSGFGSLHQQNSFNYEANPGSLQSSVLIGTSDGYLPSLDQEGDNIIIDDAYESLPSMSGDQLLSMGGFPTMNSLPSLGEFPHPSQLPVITESPPSLSETDPQADGTHAPDNTQHSVNDGHSNSLPGLSDLDGNHSGQVEIVAHEAGSDFDENADSNMDIQGHSPMCSEESVVSPQLPSTSLSNARSRPIEIPLREPVKQKLDYVLERVLVENKVPSV